MNPYDATLWRRRNSEPEPAPERLEDIPPDAPADDALLTFWNGERWEDFAHWPPYTVEPAAGSIPREATRAWAVCGSTTIELRSDGARWLMWVKVGTQYHRRKDYASPSVAHAQRTAEEWYGKARGGWRAEPASRKPPQRETRRIGAEDLKP